MKEKADRIKSLVKMTGLKYKEFSENNLISLPTLNTWIYGLTEDISLKAAKKLVLALARSGVQTSVNWIMTGHGNLPQINNIGSNLSELSHSENSLYNPNEVLKKEIDFFSQNHPSAFTLIITDDSMLPLYSIGDYVGGICFFGKDINKATGKNCIIKMKAGTALCRYLKFNKNKKFYDIYALNHNSNVDLPVISNVDIIAAAPVTRIWKTN